MKNNRRKSIAISGDAVTGGTIVAVGVLLAIATQAGWAGQSALAAPPTSAQPAPTVTPAPSIVEGGGTTLPSVHIRFPRGDNTFPGGAEDGAINNNCLCGH